MPEARAYGVTLLDAGTGRGRECEVQPIDPSGAIVSRIHAELSVGTSGGLSVRDAGSKNGTYLNDDRVTTPMPLKLGDRIALGRGGPVLIVEGLGTAPQIVVARPRVTLLARRGVRVVLLLLLAGTLYGVY